MSVAFQELTSNWKYMFSSLISICEYFMFRKLLTRTVCLYLEKGVCKLYKFFIGKKKGKGTINAHILVWKVSFQSGHMVGYSECFFSFNDFLSMV